jgi:hypothetical protein
MISERSVILATYRRRALGDSVSKAPRWFVSNHSNNLPSDEYDNQIRELVEYFRRLQMTKALDSFVNDESVLNVSSFTLYQVFSVKSVSLVAQKDMG